MDSRMKSSKLFESDLETNNLRAYATETFMFFEERFWQWRESLFFIAYRVLGDEKSPRKPSNTVSSPPLATRTRSLWTALCAYGCDSVNQPSFFVDTLV
jgi:hypothetical protein